MGASGEPSRMSTSRLPTSAAAFGRATWFFVLATSSVCQEPSREQRQAIARGTTLVVSVSAAKKPVAEVLTELSNKTGVPIERASVPADATTTLAPAQVRRAATERDVSAASERTAASDRSRSVPPAP